MTLFVARVYTGVSDRWHADYERGRPGWPREVVSVPGLPPAATVLELGAGTGKLTRLLVAAFAQVLVVEPDPGMSRLLAELCPEAQLLSGNAEAIPLPDGAADGVFVAEAFHNFDGDRAVVELARVLRLGGALVLLWNVPAGPTEPAIEDAERLLEAHVPGGLDYDPLDLNTRRFASGDWRLPFAGSPFAEFQEVRLPNPQTVDADGLVAFFGSMGWIADLPDAERLPLLAGVRARLPAAEYRRPWETRLFWTRRQAAGAW
jgi:SAM-dependent methyltransferase